MKPVFSLPEEHPFSEFDLKVGEIIKCKIYENHSYPLKIVTVDLGDGKLMKTIQNLETHIPFEKMMGVKIIIMTNMSAEYLKAYKKKNRSFKSQGMILYLRDEEAMVDRLLKPH